MTDEYIHTLVRWWRQFGELDRRRGGREARVARGRGDKVRSGGQREL